MTSNAALPEVPGYTLGQLIYNGPRSVVYRGTDSASGRSVVLKMPRAPYPSAREQAAQQRGFDIARAASTRAVVEHIALVPGDQRMVLVLEDFGGRSLQKMLQQDGPPRLESALQIGIALAEALAELHAERIIHMDINPGNVIWNPDTQRLGLVDLATSSRLEQDTAAAEDVVLESESLIYISPEQTGRINRAVDYRSDLYSAGVTLFELFCGKPPFQHDDARELVHAHLARTPPDLTAVERGIPRAVASVVAKLLAKNPDNRYASAAGVAMDLQRCLDACRGGAVADFEPGADEPRSRLVFPNRLYGRAAELEQLHEALQNASQGQRAVVLVAGYSGIGKSALIDEVRIPVASRDGWFCAGKFDQFRRDVPYLAWQSVLRSLVRQLLALPEDELAEVRASMQDPAAANLVVISELVPELAGLLGDKPALAAAGPEEAQQRFIHASRRFINIVASGHRLLVLFVDDLQWADLPSLKLFEALASDRDAANVLILGAYRDNEVGPGHPLMAAADALEHNRHTLHRMALDSLSVDDVADLLGDTLKPHTSDIRDLAVLVHAKTGGNPFFLRQFLAELVRKSFLVFDADEVTWKWQLDEINAEQFTDNVVDFMSGRLAELAADTRHAVEYAACLGSEFDLRTLANITGRSLSATAASLEGAMLEGLLVPVDMSYQFASEEAALAERDGQEVTTNPRYRFLHDRVQQSAHDRVPAARRAELHYAIALERVAEAKIDDAVAIDVMEHLSHAIDLVAGNDEQWQFARVCLAAAQRAKAAMATEPAATYLEMGRRLLPPDAWRAEPRLALDLFIESAEIAYITEHYKLAEDFGRIVLEHATGLEDRVAIHNIRIGVGVTQRRYVDATRYGLDVLDRELGVRLPRSASLPKVLAAVLAARLALAGRDDESLLGLSDMNSARCEAAMAMLMKCATNAYWADQMLVPIIASRMVRLSVRHGKTGLMAYGFALLGMVISHALGRVDYGYRLGALSMQLLEKTGDRHLVGKTGLLWHGWIRHNKEPLRLCAADTLECYHYAMEAGDVENAVYCGTAAYYGELLSGRPLGQVESRFRNYLPALLESDQQHTTMALRCWMQTAANLADATQVESKTVGDHIDWPATLAELLDEPASDMSIATVSGGAGWLAFLLDDLDEAERQFSLLYEREQSALGQCFWKPCMALYAVTLARKAEAGPLARRDRARLKRMRRALRKWSGDNPHDYACFRELLAAEDAVAAGKADRARSAWIDAMELAHDSGMLYIEAIAAERAAAAHAAVGHVAMARYLDDRARQVWGRYGARAKLRMKTGAAETKSITKSQGALASLDFDAVLSAVRTISESMEVDELAARVLNLSVLNSGARRGVLLIKDETLRPFVSATVDDKGDMHTEACQFGPSSESLPMSLVDYVSRTREAIVVDDAKNHEWLARDAYVVRHGCRSLLAMPLKQQQELVGLVLLENDLGAGVFSEADAAVVQTIAGQAAISLENARLFEAQRRQAEAFARFVPRPFLEHLGHRHIEDVRLGDNVERRVSVMFADLRGFTTLSETMDRSENFALLNGFIARMAPVLHANGGFIDEFTGDGFKALFIERPDGAAQAAIGLQGRLRRYNESRRRKGRPELAMGVGVHTGQALLGTIGAEGRASTTVIGDTVNTAARLEGLTKLFGTPSLISGTTFADLERPQELMTRPVGRVRVKGRQQPIDVHELVDARPPEDRERIALINEDFKLAMQHYLARDFVIAADLFGKCLEQVPEDQMTRYYHESAVDLRDNGAPPGWDGIMTRTEK